MAVFAFTSLALLLVTTAFANAQPATTPPPVATRSEANTSLVQIDVASEVASYGGNSLGLAASVSEDMMMRAHAGTTYDAVLRPAGQESRSIDGDVSMGSGDEESGREVGVALIKFFNSSLRGWFIEPGVQYRWHGAGDASYNSVGLRSVLGYQWRHSWGLGFSFGAQLAYDKSERMDEGRKSLGLSLRLSYAR